MANIKIDWTNPSDVSDVTGIKVFQKTGASVPGCTDYVPANALPTDTISGATEVYSTNSAPLADSPGTYTCTGLPAETYHFAVFAYNSVGFSPCSATTAGTVVSS